MSNYEYTVEFSPMAFEAPDDVEIPDSMEIDAEFTVRSNRESDVVAIQNLAIAMEVGAEDALWSELRDYQEAHDA